MILQKFNRRSSVFGQKLLSAILLFLLLFVSLLVRKTKAQSTHSEDFIKPPSIHKLWNVRERFTYSVKYGFFRIGTVTLELMPDTVYHGKKARYIKAIIKSNPKLPFVGNKEKIFNSIMAKNDTVPYTLLYWTDDVSDHTPDDEVYRMDYQNGKVYTFKKDQPVDTLSTLTKPSICGPVYFYYTRLYAGSGKNITVPIYVNQKKKSIVMDNTKETVVLKNDTFKSGQVKTYVSNGQAHFNGPFGFSGKFKAWYAADSLRLPVAASVKVWLGNVKVKLTKYSIIR